MRTPSLRARVVAAGVGVVATVLIALDLFLYVNLRSNLAANLAHVLDDRAALARSEAEGRSPGELVRRLTELGLRATVRAPDGRVFRAEPPSPRLDRNLAPGGDQPDEPRVTRSVPLPGGGSVVVEARRSGMDDTLRELLVLEVAGTAVGVVLASLLLVRVAGVALRPMEHMTAMARRVAAGHRGERLRPDRPETPVGQVAAAYDAMLDALEEVVGEARGAEAHSRAMEERARKIVDTATDAFVAVDVGGSVTDWNAGAVRLFGWSREEVVGRDAFETLFPAEVRDEHRARLELLRVTGERRERGRRLETTAVRRDGSTIDVELIIWATGEGESRTINAFVHDVTERRKAEGALHHLAAIVDSSDHAIIGTTLDGTVTSWNPAAERIYGYTAHEMVGRSIYRMVPANQRTEVANFYEMVGKGQRVPPHDTVRIPRHGPPIDVALAISPIRDTTGAVVGASNTARDITEQRWLASTLDSTLSALATALDEAVASEARSRRFLADAAHQLRTPMAGIRACAETLLRGPPAPERDRLLVDLVREVARASRLMAALLQMARMDQGEELAPAPCDLGALCRDEADRARVLAPDLAVSVDVDVLPDRVNLDRNAIREVLANLLDNARRHARSSVRIRAAAEHGGVRIRVEDDGPGLAAGAEEQVFERFVSLDGKGGSGLGLPIARGLARAHGGDLVYEEGAFVLQVPLAATETTESGETGETGELAARTS